MSLRRERGSPRFPSSHVHCRWEGGQDTHDSFPGMNAATDGRVRSWLPIHTLRQRMGPCAPASQWFLTWPHPGGTGGDWAQVCGAAVAGGWEKVLGLVQGSAQGLSPPGAARHALSYTIP